MQKKSGHKTIVTLKTVPKILIIQTAFLGDVILALPVVQTLKKLLPDAFIDFICIPQTADVLLNNLHLRKVIVYDKKGRGKASKLFNVISRVRRERYDIVICPHRSLRSALITYFSKARIKVGFDKNALPFLLNRKVPYVQSKHEIQRNLDLIRNLPGINFGDDAAVLKPKLFPSHNDEIFIEKLLDTMNLKNSALSEPVALPAPVEGSKDPALSGAEGLIVLAPCSKWFTKRLTGNKSVEIIKRLIASGFRVVLIGSADDRPYCKEVEKLVSNSSLINLCGNLTPLQSAVLIGKSKCLITVDSAAAHLGASTDTPIVQIYGSTVPAFGFYPLTSKNIIIENNSLDCRPCTDHGRTSCPLKHFKCIEDIDPGEVIEAVKKLINKS